MNGWELVTSRARGTSGARRTVYHRRQISQRPHTWLTAQDAGAGEWVWHVYLDGKVTEGGVRKTWQRARAAADVAYDRAVGAR